MPPITRDPPALLLERLRIIRKKRIRHFDQRFQWNRRGILLFSVMLTIIDWTAMLMMERCWDTARVSGKDLPLPIPKLFAIHLLCHLFIIIIHPVIFLLFLFSSRSTKLLTVCIWLCRAVEIFRLWLICGELAFGIFAFQKSRYFVYGLGLLLMMGVVGYTVCTDFVRYALVAARWNLRKLENEEKSIIREIIAWRDSRRR